MRLPRDARGAEVFEAPHSQLSGLLFLSILFTAMLIAIGLASGSASWPAVFWLVLLLLPVMTALLAVSRVRTLAVDDRGIRIERMLHTRVVPLAAIAAADIKTVTVKYSTYHIPVIRLRSGGTIELRELHADADAIYIAVSSRLPSPHQGRSPRASAA